MNSYSVYPNAYLEYLIHFHIHRDYFECHEVLEEFWKEENKQEIIWVGLIQVAVALYHQRRSNFSGAMKMMTSALRILQAQPAKLTSLGLHFESFVALLQQRLEEIKEQQAYSSFDLPLTENVLQHCRSYCQLHDLEWCSNHNITNEFLIHKHTLRDRSAVIQEREQSKQKKKPS